MGWVVSTYSKDSDCVFYIDIGSIDDELKKTIDDHIAKICYGDPCFSISKAKKYIRDFISSEDENRKKGAVAEFFLHLFLNQNSFKQKCTFKNLEESSPKKGFDGVYSDAGDNVWYMESKSGGADSTTHKDKVEEAYRDLKDKFSGTTKNDPWINAYYHVKAVDSDEPLLDKFRKYSDDFDKKIGHNINEFCIIPCGTVVADSITAFDSDGISECVFNYFNGKDYNKLIAICVTQRAMSEFVDYLEKDE